MHLACSLGMLSLGDLRKFSVRLNSLAEPQEKEPHGCWFCLGAGYF